MALVTFKRGLKDSLPSVGQDGVLYVTTDSHEIYKGVEGDQAPVKLSDVIFVEELPENGIEDKLYGKLEGENISLHTYKDGQWFGFSGGIDDNTLNEILGFVNKTEDLTYDEEGNIIGVSVTGDIEKDISYDYDEDGNIISEEIVQGDKKVTNTFSYNNDDEIIKIETVVEDK